MPYDEPDPSDPNILVGVNCPAGPGDLEELAYSLAEEYAFTGMEPGRILDLFRSPDYAIPHSAWLALGESRVSEIVDECTGAFSRFRVVVRDAPEHGLIQIDPGD